MWANAIEQVQRITGMRLSIATDTYLQTYAGLRAPWMTGQVMRVKNNDGTETIHGTFACRYDCNGIDRRAERLFNVMVKPLGYDVPSLSPTNK
jgi:hypothetical protein